MPTRTSRAEWTGDLPSGSGSLTVGDDVFTGSYSFPSRFEEGEGTNPEELIAAAHAACFSMALSNILAKAGHTPTRVATTAHVTLGTKDGAAAITGIELVCEAEVPGIDDAAFQEKAAEAKGGCPVSKALAATPIDLQATLL